MSMNRLARRWGAVVVMGMASAFASGCSFVGGVFGIRSMYEAPAYAVNQRFDTFELRQYQPRLAAEVSVPNTADADGKALGLLFNYISGANAGQQKMAMTVPVETRPAGEKIAMTVPVETASDADQVTMRFFLPSAVQQTGAPEPTDPAVRIVELPSQTLAVRTFRGAVSAGRLQRAKIELLGDTRREGYSAVGEPVIYYYDPPFTLPWFRRTEVAVPADRP